jgi:hypothetical protein
MSIERSVTTRRSAVAILSTLLFLPVVSASAQSPAILVHKDPHCGCCSKWVLHLERGGFIAKVEETDDLEAVRRRLGVPTALAGCHTAEIDGYVIEGHVPVAAIRRLLQERPQAVGLSVPGMPAGSPGMEGPSAQRYAAILFGKSGQRTYMEFLGTHRAS